MTTGETTQHAEAERQQGETPPAASALPLPPSLLHARELLLNRELSLLEFHRRVLEEALDPTHPLLERIKFVAIFSTILDEFFMVRVSGLKELAAQDTFGRTPDGMTPAEQLREARARSLEMVAAQSRLFAEELLPKLREQGIAVTPYHALARGERDALDAYFSEQVYPVLTPQGVDPGHPFPYISSLSVNIGLMVEPVRAYGITSSLTGRPEPRFVRLKVPPVVPRLVAVGESGDKFVFLEELIAANLSQLFPRMGVGKPHLFRVTRDADIAVREDKAEDLLLAIEQTLRKRLFGAPVRLEVSATMPEEMVKYLTEMLDLAPEDVYAVEGPLGLSDLTQLYDLNRPELKDRPLRTTVPAPLKSGPTVFDAIRRQDVLLHHPYTSYSTVIDFVRSAARDPDVLAIKMCLYRTGHNSPIPQALIEASERGKQVTALVELKARFDEEANIEWARRLEQAGVHVIYGVLGLKTHCKVALVVRREGGRLGRYVHIATGNYNPFTASFYTDLGLLTADEELGADATDLFNFLTGYSRQKEYRRMLVAPVNLRERMLALIEREAEHQRAGRPARIVAKFNRLADLDIIRALYTASQAGVRIDLIVRGVCMLRPGVEGLSETIRVRSVVGRLLEHSRVYYFRNGGDEEVFIGSADWMQRNLDRRVEVVAPVRDPDLKRYLKDVVLATYLRDNVKARELRPDGTYARVPAAPGDERVDSQMYFEGSISVSD